MKKRDNCYYFTLSVPYGDCDFKGTFKLSAVMKLLAEVAGKHYYERGMGHDELLKKGMVFLLAKERARFFRAISAEEVITVETCERGVKGAYFYRDFTVYDKGGAAVLAAKTVWILCSPDAHALLRPSALSGKFAENWEYSAACGEPQKIVLPNDLTYSGARRTVYSDLDENAHVNNTVYGDIACDFLPFELMKRDIAEYEISFDKELKIGDELSVFTKTENDTSVVLGKLADRNSFVCKLTYFE